MACALYIPAVALGAWHAPLPVRAAFPHLTPFAPLVLAALGLAPEWLCFVICPVLTGFVRLTAFGRNRAQSDILLHLAFRERLYAPGQTGIHRPEPRSCHCIRAPRSEKAPGRKWPHLAGSGWARYGRPSPGNDTKMSQTAFRIPAAISINNNDE